MSQWSVVLTRRPHFEVRRSLHRARLLRPWGGYGVDFVVPDSPPSDGLVPYNRKMREDYRRYAHRQSKLDPWSIP